MKKLLAILLTLSMLLAFCGCSSSESSTTTAAATTGSASTDAEETSASIDDEAMQEKLNTTLYVGCSVRTYSNPYMVTIAEGCELFCEYLDSLGQDYVFEVMLNEGSSDTQVEQINAFLAKSNGNAILFCDPNEAAICTTIAEMVTDAGAYMCTTWNKPDDVDVWDYDGWVAHTSPDDVEMGYAIAVAMFSEFDTPYEGTIIAIQGLLGNTTAVNRFAGLEQALEEYPGVELVANEAADWSADTALEVMETLLAKYPDIDGVWCANDNMATGVVRALEAAGLAGEVKVCGLNAIETALDYIEEGYMTVTCDCQGWQQGGYSLAYCYDAWLGKFDVASLDHSMRLFGTTYTIVNPDNVAEFRQTYYVNDIVLDFENYLDVFRTGDYPV